MKASFTISINITPINKFYKRDDRKIGDYIFVIAKCCNVYHYINFLNIEHLFNQLCGERFILNCDKKYIDENFTEISIEDIINE